MKKRAIFWLREDFRILNNQALAMHVKIMMKFYVYSYSIQKILLIKEKRNNGG